MNNKRIIRKGRVDFVEVADNVFAVLTPHKGLCWSNAGFINRGRGLVVDTFSNLPDACKLKEFCLEVHGTAPAYVVNTHSNFDHFFGNQLFTESDIIAQNNFFEENKPGKLEFWTMVQKDGKQSGKPGLMFLADNIEGLDFAGITPTLPNITIDRKMTVLLDDTRVEIIHPGPAHTNSDLLIWLPKEKVLFTGDIVFESAMVYSETGAKGWVKVLDYIQNELKPEVIVPGHGHVCDFTFLSEIKGYFQNIIDSVEKYYSDEISALELAKKVDVRDYLHWNQPERVFVSISSFVKERRKLPIVMDWDYFSINMTELKAYHDKIYGCLRG